MALLDSSFPTVTCSNFLLKSRASMPVTRDSFLTQIRRVRSFITVFVLLPADRRVSSTCSVTLYHSTVSLAAPQRRLRLVAILRFRKPPMVYYPLSISGFTPEVNLLPFPVSLTGEHIASCSYRCVSLYQPSLIISTVSVLSKKIVLLVKVDISFRRGNSPSSRTVFGSTTDPFSPPFISISRLDPSNPQDARRVQSQPRVRSTPPARKASLALVGVSTFNLRILWIASKIFCRGRVETLIEMGQILFMVFGPEFIFHRSGPNKSRKISDGNWSASVFLVFGPVFIFLDIGPDEHKKNTNGDGPTFALLVFEPVFNFPVIGLVERRKTLMFHLCFSQK